MTDELEVLSSVVASQDAAAPAVRRRGAGDRLAGPRRADPAGHRRDAAAGRRDAGRDLTRWPWPTRRGWPARCWWGWRRPRRCALALDMPLVAVNHLQAHVYACRMAAGEDVFPVRGTDRQRRAYEPVSLPRAAGFRAAWAARSTTRPARRSTRWPACWGCPIPAGRRSSGRPAAAIRGRIALPRAAASTRRAARFQLQRPEDGRALSTLPTRGGCMPIASCSSRSRWPTWRPVFRRPWSIAWSPRPAGARANRPEDPVRRRRRGGQWPLPRAAGRAKPRGAASRCTFRRCGSAPTTP